MAQIQQPPVSLKNKPKPLPHSDWYVSAMEELVSTVQNLSLARDLGSVMSIVRKAARSLTRADGATFVLRDGDKCYYADEDAISPLWKGQRFPMKTCISGWVMMNAEPAIIEDIFKDERIPVAAYRPTFVKSLAMVPIRSSAPVGAIGNYWADRHKPTDEEIAILQALANVTSVTMENLSLYDSLKDKVEALEKSNSELNSFAWAAAHDLKTPLRGIDQLAQWIIEDYEDGQPDQFREHISALQLRATRMENLLDSIFEYAQLESQAAPENDKKVLGTVIRQDILALIDLPDGFALEFSDRFNTVLAPRVTLQRILFNLIGNAIKHHDKQEGHVRVDAREDGTHYIFSVEDDGPGIAPEYHERIFKMFQSLKPKHITEGSGMGLSLVKKILLRYGGEITLKSKPGKGSTFSFTWPRDIESMTSSGKDCVK